MIATLPPGSMRVKVMRVLRMLGISREEKENLLRLRVDIPVTSAVASNVMDRSQNGGQ